MELRADAATWLAERGSDQWQLPWPSLPEMIAAVESDIERQRAWVLRGRDDSIIATITVDDTPNPGLWTADEMAVPALYAHRLIVDRSHHGQALGAQVLDWATVQARSRGCTWLRLDAWSTNQRLHDYYRRLGFTYLRTVVLAHNPSGALFQRHVSAGPPPQE